MCIKCHCLIVSRCIAWKGCCLIVLCCIRKVYTVELVSLRRCTPWLLISWTLLFECHFRVVVLFLVRSSPSNNNSPRRPGPHHSPSTHQPINRTERERERHMDKETYACALHYCTWWSNNGIYLSISLSLLPFNNLAVLVRRNRRRVHWKGNELKGLLRPCPIEWSRLAFVPHVSTRGARERERKNWCKRA